MTIPPPFPAPYLEGITTLPDLILSQIDGRRSLERQQERTFEHSVNAIARRVRHAREAFEAKHGVIIEPEVPRLPAEIDIASDADSGQN